MGVVMREGIYIFVWKGKGNVLSRAGRVVDHLHQKSREGGGKNRAELIKILVSILTVRLSGGVIRHFYEQTAPFGLFLSSFKYRYHERFSEPLNVIKQYRFTGLIEIIHLPT